MYATPQEPVCAVCHMAMRPGQDRVTVQQQHYHARCYERCEYQGVASRGRTGLATLVPPGW
jgi:hypothetical protein